MWCTLMGARWWAANSAPPDHRDYLNHVIIEPEVRRQNPRTVSIINFWWFKFACMNDMTCAKRWYLCVCEWTSKCWCQDICWQRDKQPFTNMDWWVFRASRLVIIASDDAFAPLYSGRWHVATVRRTRQTSPTRLSMDADDHVPFW